MNEATDETRPGHPPPGEAGEAEAVAALLRCVEILNDAALALMIATGHRVGLFDVLAGLPPSTSQKVADAAGLEERYVREWLSGMTTGRIVSYDPTEGTYSLMTGFAACLTEAEGPINLARQMQYIPMLGTVIGEVAECFRSGGGVPYSAFGEFHRLMADNSAATQDALLVDEVVPLVEGLSERLCAGIDVADIGCGSGHAVNLLAREFPASRFVGYDFSEEAIAQARREAAELGLDNARFEVRDAAELDLVGAYDLVTAFDAIHDQAHPALVLANIASALRPSGTFLMADVKASSNLEDNLDHPVGPFLYTVSTMHCMTVSLALDGAGLGTAWGHELARQMLREAGFERVELAELDDDAVNTYYLASKRSSRD